MRNFDETVWTQLHKNGGLTFQDYDQLQKDILSAKTVISKEFYDRHVLGIFNTDNDRHEFLVGGRGCNKMARMMDYSECEELSVSFLFDKDKWNGNKIGNMTSSHIINTLLMLNRKSNKFKLDYEMFVIDNMNNDMLVPKDDINELSKMCPIEWIVSTPVYGALIAELDNRGLLEYYNNVQERIATSEKGE